MTPVFFFLPKLYHHPETSTISHQNYGICDTALFQQYFVGETVFRLLLLTISMMPNSSCAGWWTMSKCIIFTHNMEKKSNISIIRRTFSTFNFKRCEFSRFVSRKKI